MVVEEPLLCPHRWLRHGLGLESSFKVAAEALREFLTRIETNEDWTGLSRPIGWDG